MKTFNKIFIITSVLILNLLFSNKVFAATLSLNPSKDSVGIGEQFYIDLMLDPEGQSVNTISGSVSFANNINFIRVEDGKSMVNLWVEKPKLQDNNVNFTGVMSNGFNGVIDPFNPNKKLPGLIARLVFEAKSPGPVEFFTTPFSLNLNDGIGTEIKSSMISVTVDVGNYISKLKYENERQGVPELEAFITRDPNIFNNKYILIFKANDKETGIKSVTIKEGNNDWQEIESPYLLKDQSRHSQIMVSATNFSEQSVTVNIDAVPYNWQAIINISIIIISIIILSIYVIIKKRHAKNK